MSLPDATPTLTPTPAAAPAGARRPARAPPSPRSHAPPPRAARAGAARRVHGAPPRDASARRSPGRAPVYAGTPSTSNAKKRSYDEMAEVGASTNNVRAGSDFLREVLSRQYASGLGDLAVSMQFDEDGEPKTFTCSSALLAAASPMLEAMLFRPMGKASLLDAPRSDRVLHLKGWAPEHFETLLHFVHGKEITFSDGESVELYQMADYYGAVDLRDICSEHWIACLDASNCCEFLQLANKVSCEALERRCLDMLTLRFSEVLYGVVSEKCELSSCQGRWCALPADVLASLLKSDALGCSCERDVLSGLLSWYATSPCLDSEAGRLARRAQLPDMLQSVRWDRVLQPHPSKDTTIWRRGRFERKDRETSEPSDDEAIAQLCSLKKSHVIAKVQRGLALWGVVSEVADDVVQLVKERLDDVDPANLYAPSSPPRQYTFGRLEMHDPSRSWASGSRLDEWTMHGHAIHVIGRSRSAGVTTRLADLHVSARHCRFFSRVHYSPDTGAQLVAFVEDLGSMNGTFVNGENIGKGEMRRLGYADRIGVGQASVHFVFYTPCAVDA
jgi:hypothetical protein